jgi:hypothetical protein
VPLPWWSRPHYIPKYSINKRSENAAATAAATAGEDVGNKAGSPTVLKCALHFLLIQLRVSSFIFILNTCT